MKHTLEHRTPPAIMFPIIWEGCDAYELAAAHQYHLKRNHIDVCERIEEAVNKSNLDTRRTISKLDYYKPTIKPKIFI